MACRICELCHHGCVFISRPKFPAERPGANVGKRMQMVASLSTLGQSKRLAYHHRNRSPLSVIGTLPTSASHASASHSRPPGRFTVSSLLLCVEAAVLLGLSFCGR